MDGVQKNNNLTDDLTDKKVQFGWSPPLLLIPNLIWQINELFRGWHVIHICDHSLVDSDGPGDDDEPPQYTFVYGWKFWRTTGEIRHAAEQE